MSSRQRGSKLRGDQDINITQFGGANVGLNNPIYTAMVVAGIVVDPRNRNWTLGVGDIPSRSWTLNQATDSVQVAAAPGVLFDVSDRWARELGQVDLARVLGVALSAVNPVIAGIYDAAGNRMPSMDAAARPGYVDVIDRWTRTLGQFDLARVLGAPLTSANPVISGIFDAAGNRMPAMDAAIRPGYVDVIDRWARQLGLIDISRVLGVALTSANPVITGLFDAAGNRMPSMDVAARPGFVDVIDRWARQLGLVDLSRVLGAALTSANPVIAGIFDAAGNRMPSMDAAARPGYVDVVDVTDTKGALDHGSNLDIDTAAEQITVTSYAAERGVCFKADSANSGILYLGNSDVTAGTVAATDGIPLSAGDSITLPVNNPNLVYAIASVNDQKIYWIAV